MDTESISEKRLDSSSVELDRHTTRIVWYINNGSEQALVDERPLQRKEPYVLKGSMRVWQLIIRIITRF